MRRKLIAMAKIIVVASVAFQIGHSIGLRQGWDSAVQNIHQRGELQEHVRKRISKQPGLTRST